jgi:hypothetical protein
MKIFIILDMKKNNIDHFSLKIIVLTSIDRDVLTAQPCPIVINVNGASVATV